MRIPDATLIRYNGSRASYVSKRRADLAQLQANAPRESDPKAQRDKYAADVAKLQQTIADNE